MRGKHWAERVTDLATEQMDGSARPKQTFPEPWATALRVQTPLLLPKQSLVTEVTADNGDVGFKQRLHSIDWRKGYISVCLVGCWHVEEIIGRFAAEREASG